MRSQDQNHPTRREKSSQQELSAMNCLAANRTGRRAAPPPAKEVDRTPAARLGFVEDLNWPVPPSPTDKKAPRPVVIWVPGPNGWEGETATIQ